MAHSDRIFDVAIVGAGIVGLAHALAAARQGKRVVVFDRDADANGASVRNFGFITVTGQQDGDCWRRARRSRDVWAEIAEEADLRVVHEGLAVVAQRDEALGVLEAFADTEMAEQCELLTPAAARLRLPMLSDRPIEGVLWSPLELRVESRQAIPRLAAWLERVHGVAIYRQTLVRAVDLPSIDTTAGRFAAETCIVCPGDDLLTLFPERLAAYGLTRCKLQMLRLAPQPSEWLLPAAVMSDLSLVRYAGYAELPEAEMLRECLEAEQPEALRHGVHLIAVQDADGSLVVGDSHHYTATPDPFASSEVEKLILDELNAVLQIAEPAVAERWTGTYAAADDRLMLVDRPEDGLRIVVVTSGTGASTAFAIAEEVMAELYGTGEAA